MLFNLPSTITGHLGWITLINAIWFALEVPQELCGDDFVETKLELRHACALTQLRLKMNKIIVAASTSLSTEQRATAKL